MFLFQEKKCEDELEKLISEAAISSSIECASLFVIDEDASPTLM
jgi:hypothetical protein